MCFLLDTAEFVVEGAFWYNIPKRQPGICKPMSTNTYDSWADSFHFSDDLKVLEQVYQEQHQVELRKQARKEPALKPVAPPTVETPQTEDDRVLSQLSQQIATGLSAQISGQVARTLEEHLAHPEWVAPFEELTELRHDNARMAEQISALLKEVETLRERCNRLELENARFRPLMGSVYLKQ